jgi:hypothetical protein
MVIKSLVSITGMDCRLLYGLVISARLFFVVAYTRVRVRSVLVFSARFPSRPTCPDLSRTISAFTTASTPGSVSGTLYFLVFVQAQYLRRNAGFVRAGRCHLVNGVKASRSS